MRGICVMKEDVNRGPERRVVPETPARILVASITAHLRNFYQPDEAVPEHIRQLIGQLEDLK
jgi:hypothetical protein